MQEEVESQPDVTIWRTQQRVADFGCEVPPTPVARVDKVAAYEVASANEETSGENGHCNRD